MKIYQYNGKCNICGERIRAARIDREMSQDDLAAQMQLRDINITQKAVSRIETGLRVVADYELRTLAEILGVDVNWLLGGPPFSPPAAPR